jgi:hypothetical protein
MEYGSSSFILTELLLFWHEEHRFEIEISASLSAPTINISGQCGSLHNGRNIQERNRTV